MPKLNNKALIRLAIWNKLRDEGYSSCTEATPLYLRWFRENGELRVYRAKKNNTRTYFIEVRRAAYRGVPAVASAAQKLLQERLKQPVRFLAIGTNPKTGKMVVRLL